MTQPPKTMREEFEKAFSNQFYAPGLLDPTFDKCLWAAKWMAERCANEISIPTEELAKRLFDFAPGVEYGRRYVQLIRQLIEEMKG